VYAAARTAVERARSGGGPTLIEARTHRFTAHAYGLRGMAGASAASSWPEDLDPIELLASRCLAEDLLSKARIGELRLEVVRTVEAALQFARDSEQPAPETAYEGLFAVTPGS
jgi:pyruvate dehydrogenase E1 component alpha subunit